MARDPYAVLGVEKSASQAEIKRRYRKIAKENHPDLKPGDADAESRFKAASQAYAILGDEDQRAKFDTGEIDAAGQERPPHHFYRPHAETGDGAKYYRHEAHGDFDDLGSVFEDLFGARAQRSGSGGQGFGGQGFGGQGYESGGTMRMRGADARYSLEIDFLEAARGATKRVTMPDGKALDIRIPPGLADGQTLRLKGKGMPGTGGADAGDALVTVGVRPHPHFTRAGDDIHLELPISLREAVLGAKVTVPTVSGNVTLTIPPNASSGTVLRLKGRGIGAGSQLVTLKVVLPKKADPALKTFLEENPAVAADDPRAGEGLAS